MDRAQLRNIALATGCARGVGDFVLLEDPRWGAAERGETDAVASALEDLHVSAARGWLGIPTGGSSGRIKFARHDETTLGAAVQGFREFFDLRTVNAVDILPAYHVSGFMARVRCAATGGRHMACDWKAIEGGDRPELSGGPWVISLVPTQLQRLLASVEATAWLRGFEIVFAGGGPLWPELADQAAGARVRLAPSYGMTETAAMVAALRPDEFLAGARSSGRALPHAMIALDADGVVRVSGASVFFGYAPAWEETHAFTTSDLGEFDAQGGLRILGRRDAVIITGGEKVQPAEVESVLRATGEFSDVAVIGVADAEWGEIVVACHPAGCVPDRGRVEAALDSLAAFKRPKKFLGLSEWPRNAQGKLSRAKLRELVK